MILIPWLGLDLLVTGGVRGTKISDGVIYSSQTDSHCHNMCTLMLFLSVMNFHEVYLDIAPASVPPAFLFLKHLPTGGAGFSLWYVQ